MGVFTLVEDHEHFEIETDKINIIINVAEICKTLDSPKTMITFHINFYYGFC